MPSEKILGFSVVTQIIVYFQKKVNIFCNIFRTPILKRKEFFMLYDNVKRIANEKGLSILQIERECGLKPSSIYHWNESMPSGDKLVAVAGYLGTTPQNLLEEKEG